MRRAIVVEDVMVRLLLRGLRVVKKERSDELGVGRGVLNALRLRDRLRAHTKATKVEIVDADSSTRTPSVEMRSQQWRFEMITVSVVKVVMRLCCC